MKKNSKIIELKNKELTSVYGGTWVRIRTLVNGRWEHVYVKH